MHSKDQIYRILIVEDNIEQARLMELILKRDERSFSVELVNNAETALKRLATEPFHAVVLDYSLPTLNGLETLQEIKKRNIRIPVVMVTGRGDEMIAVEAMRQGVYDYLVKTRDHINTLARVLVRAIEEHRLSSELEQSEQRYFALFDRASVAIFIADVDNYRLLQVNKMARELTGFSQDFLLGKTFLQLCSSKTRSKAQQALAQIIKSGQANFDTVWLIRADGYTFPTDISGSLVKIGEKSVLQLFVRDTTEKIKMQRQLLLSRQRLISVFDGITDLISVQNHDLKLIMANKKYAQFCGRPTSKLIGQKCHKVLFERDEPCAQCPALTTYKTGKTQFAEMYYQGKTFQISTFPMAGLDGRTDFVVEYVKDVTEQKEIEKQLIKSEKLASIGLLSSGIAHELRNPLNVIETARYSIEDSLAHSDKDLDRKLEIIKRNIRRASRIIDNLLEFSRHSEFEREKVNVTELIDKTLSLVEKEIITRNIYIHKTYNDVPPIYFSLDSLKQVFLNIILNAVQAMPDGGQLKITTSLAKNGNWVYVDFSDSGVGISKENLQHIFTPFFSTKRSSGGTGLGLYISYTIINREGGDILVKNNKDRGATFTVKLPVAGNDNKQTRADTEA